MRARQVSAMFDVPVSDKCRLHYDIEFPIDSFEWNVGAIVGPSGSGKSTVMRRVWGEPTSLQWAGGSVLDDFPTDRGLQEITEVCSAVGFNTIPAWMRPFEVLSGGEKFRVELARRLLEGGDPVVVDEFTSVVDRQVAQIGSHAVQKHVRKNGTRFVAVACHYDFLDWLQPDWVLDMATQTFTRRLLQRRPAIECVVGRVPYAAWGMFAPFHYLTGELHRSARCFGLWANGRLAAFAGMLHRPHPKVDDIMGCSRLVTLPDWQGVGLALALIDQVGAAYKGAGKRARTYPAHPALIRSFDRSPKWSMVQKPGTASNSTRATKRTVSIGESGMGGRPCAVFEYIGEAIPRKDAERLLG
jgi:ABC-type lipoprotein export system ATPase subunit